MAITLQQGGDVLLSTTRVDKYLHLVDAVLFFLELIGHKCRVSVVLKRPYKC